MTDNRALNGVALLGRYERAWLRPDVVAGLTVTAYLVPQVMAYAQLAGLDPVVGLWSAILPAIVYALVGTSRHVSTGPESTTAVMVAVAVAPLAAGDPLRYVALTSTLALLVGAICVVGGALRLGFLGDLLSHPILVGYMAGVALIMVVSQLQAFTGVPIQGDSVIGQLGEFVSNLGAVHAPTFALAMGVVAFLFAARRWMPWLPGPLVAMIGATVLVAFPGLDDLQAEPPQGGRPSDTAAPGTCTLTVGLMRTTVVQPLPTRRVQRERGSVRIRAVRPTDAAALEQFYAGLSGESRRTRFFSLTALSHAQSVSFCTTDHDHREGFVAVVDFSPSEGEQIVGHLCLEPDGADAAEVAIAVADEFQHQGIGRRLMAAGLAWARREHVARFTATMFANNAPINRLLVGLGLPVQERWAGAGVAEITISLDGQSAAA